ncbi:hypothetical protein D3C79_813730 [compost metagenome]
MTLPVVGVPVPVSSVRLEVSMSSVVVTLVTRPMPPLPTVRRYSPACSSPMSTCTPWPRGSRIRSSRPRLLPVAKVTQAPDASFTCRVKVALSSRARALLVVSVRVGSAVVPASTVQV